METYPVAYSRSLGPAVRQGARQAWRRSRTISEIPRLEPHQALVFKVDDELIVDNVQYALDSPYVVDAHHVSLVDMRQNAPVEVTLKLASADSADFEVNVTFGCTVRDPKTIVRNRVVDVSGSLALYLKGNRKILNVGTRYSLLDYAEVRRRVSAKITASVDLDPPFIPGLDVSLISVEVPPPTEVGIHHGELRNLNFSQVIKSKNQRGEHSLSQTEQAHQMMLGNLQRANQRNEELVDGAHNARLEDEIFQAKIKHFKQVLEIVGSEAHNVRVWAMTIGQGEAREVAQALEQAALERVRTDAALTHDQLQVYSQFLRTLVERGHFDDVEASHLLKDFAAKLNLPNFAEAPALAGSDDGNGKDTSLIDEGSTSPTQPVASEEDDGDEPDLGVTHVR